MYGDESFRKRYRFSKENAMKLITLVKPDLKGKKNKGGRIPAYLQVLSALRCWGRNDVQDNCGEIHGFSQSTMCRISKKVATAFAKHAKDVIHFPKTTQEQIHSMNEFEKFAGLKRIIGAIDCTHLRIQAVAGDDAQLYVNRKGYFSYNVQVICDASMRIVDIVAFWKGSTHHSRIFNESLIKKNFEEGKVIGKLVGDGGYKCTNYLFTIINNPKMKKKNNTTKLTSKLET